MSSELSILNATQKAEFLEIWNQRGLGPPGIILSMLMVAIVNDGGPTESELLDRHVVDGGTVTIPGSKYRATWGLKDPVATDTQFTIEIGTSWELTSADRAALGRELAKFLKADLIPRVMLSYNLCDSPPR